MRNFDEFCNELLEYKHKYGDCLVRDKYITETGFKLGQKVTYVRMRKANLSDEEIKRLDDIGFKWHVYNKRKSFKKLYELLIEYKKEYGNCLVPYWYQTKEGINLGVAIYEIRSGQVKITAMQRKLLEKLEFEWRVKTPAITFEEIYDMLLEYKRKYGNCVVSANYIRPDGVKLGYIVSDIRMGTLKLDESQKLKLQKIGFI